MRWAFLVGDRILLAGVVEETVLVSTLLTLAASNGAPATVPAAAVPLVAAVGLLPLSVLFPFVLRLATVTPCTVATTPSTPEQEGNPAA